MDALIQPVVTKRLSPLVGACLTATWLVWGSTYLAIKLALISFPPFFQMGTRFLAAGGILFLWTALRGLPMPTRTQWRNAIIVGALMLGGGMGGAAYSEQSVASGLVVAYIAITPAAIALMNLFFGIRPSKLETSGMAVGLFGVLLLVRGSGFSAAPVGLAALGIGNVAWALGSVLSQRKFPLAQGGTGFASEMLCGGALLVLLSLCTGERFHWPVQPAALWAWTYLVFFGSLIAFSAYMVLLTRARAALATSYSFVNPIIGMLLGVTLGNELVTNHEWWAVAIIVCGVILLIFGKRQPGDLRVDGVCADNIRQKLGIAAATASRHLTLLTDAQLLIGTRKKGWTLYRRGNRAIERFARRLKTEL